jgi:uncharacterized Zn finger protein
MSWYEWRPYMPVAERRRQAHSKLKTLRKKGQSASPVTIEGRTIAKSFWGQSWCSNLERYSDFANRLPRGRTYVRNGSVVDLQIVKGEVLAFVSGSELYKIKIGIAPVAARRWRSICRDCSGTIDSLVELLQGRLAKGVMDRVCREGDGLFPTPAEIKLSCSCPDWADMCKHVAAALYGVGARLDEQPRLLFVLRGVDENELLAGAGQDLSLTTAAPASAQVLDDGDVAALFGLEMAEPAKADAAIAASAPKVAATLNGRKARLKTKAAPGSKQAAAKKANILEATPGKSEVKPPTPAAKPARARSTMAPPPGRDRRHA